MDIELISAEKDLLHINEMMTQAAYIAEKCLQLGFHVKSHTITEERDDELCKIAAASLERTDMLMVLCGKGTDLKKIREWISERVLHRKELSDQDIVMERHGGKKNGIFMKENDKTVILLPESEEQLKAIFEQELYLLLQKEQKETVYFAAVKLCGIEEESLRNWICDIREEYPDATITVTSGYADYCVRICAQAEDGQAAKKTLKPILKAALEKFGDAVYSTDDSVSLEASVLGLLAEKNLTVTTAESLTGGLLATRFTAVPGASEVFKQGFVTYCNRAKRKMLDVKKSTLKTYGAVSERTAREMAKNGVFMTGSDVCVSLTGLAGPAAEEGKPVGLVYIACCYKNRTTVKEYHLKGSRKEIREQAAVQSLLLLRECILNDQ